MSPLPQKPTSLGRLGFAISLLRLQPKIRTFGLLVACFTLVLNCGCSSIEEAQRLWPLRTMTPKGKALLASVKPGMTRAQLEEHFFPDGGLQIGRYCFFDGTPDDIPIVFLVHFRPAKMDPATYSDIKRRGKWYESHTKQSGNSLYLERRDDVVVSLDKPERCGLSID